MTRGGVVPGGSPRNTVWQIAVTCVTAMEMLTEGRKKILITAMLISGKISTGVRKMVMGVRMMMSSAITTNVYGRRSANATIHIGLAETGNGNPNTGGNRTAEAASPL